MTGMIQLLSVADIAALGFFVAVWWSYALLVSGRLFGRISLTAAMNAQRLAWMHTMARRELRMIDTGIMNGLQQGTAFFASTSLVAIGGCFALLGASDQVIAVLGDLPFESPPPRPVFEFKVLGLIVLLVYSFFKFGWAYRLFNYCSILVGAAPVRHHPEPTPEELETAIVRAARLNIIAGKHFNAGLRGIFFSLGYLGWFVGPWVLAVSTLLVAAVLIRRQFFSEARRVVLADSST